MVSLKDTMKRMAVTHECVGSHVRKRGDYELVMRIPHPRERACDADRDRQIRDHAHDEHRVVVVLVVDEDERDAEDEPRKARCRAAGMDAAEVLEC